INDSNIPHRTSVSYSMDSFYDKMMGIWGEELRNTLGRISFTKDIWTDDGLRSYMAVTAHYVVETPA
ncbi:hypothetical protein CPB86DRAFT_679436, partial [Serendipita vermifera]